jgi:hypothetical protein
MHLISELPGLSLGRTPAIMTGFLQSLQENTNVVRSLGHDRILSDYRH